MIEIFYIITEILFIITIFSLPIILVDKNYYVNSLKLNLIDKLSINLIILVNVLFLFSILNIHTKYFLYLYFLVLFFLILFNYKKINLKNIKINYFLIFLLFFTFLLSIDLADQVYLAWDAQRFWFFKTLNFYQNQNIQNLKLFLAPDYPHLGTFIWSFFWKFPHGEFEYLGRIFYIFIYLLSILSLSVCLKLERLEKIIFAILLISLTYSYELFSGLQDVVIFSSILFFARFVYLIFENNQKSNKFFLVLVLLGLFNLLSLTKNEGIFYGLFLLFSLFLTYNFSKLDKKFIIFGTLLVLFIRVLIFKYYDIQLDPTYYEIDETATFDIALLIQKIKTITFYILIYVSQNLVYLITMPLLVLVIYRCPKIKIINFIIYFFILNLIFIYLAYMFKLSEVELQIKASMKRVIFQTSGFYFLTIIIYINNCLNYKKNIKN